MIKVNRLHKFFNINKSNEIHVINDVSLELPEKGLVAIFGPSGCGKTTLLNVIGGLDCVQRGSITIGDTTLSKYNCNKWDNLRNREVGYVFQNYNLLSDISVKENIDIALRLAGIESGEEREKRTMHVLQALGIAKYKNRRPDTLSGGQQQRVAIARAIAKHPNIVIADEPTGNLDAKNTIATMDILKQISRNCLVLLVTHEPKIVDYYADKVIQLSDGKIANIYDNDSEKSLSLTDKGKIYLQDLSQEKTKTNSGVVNVNYYGDENASVHSINLSVVCVEGKYYIKADTDVKVELLENDSEIALLDEKFIPRSREETEKTLVDLNIIKPVEKKKKNSPLITHGQAMKQAAKKFFGKKTKKSKLGNFGFAISAALMVISVAMMGSLFNIDRTTYATAVDNYVRVERLSFGLISEEASKTYAEGLVELEGTNGIYKIYPSAIFMNSNTFRMSVSLSAKKFNQVGAYMQEIAVSNRLSFAPIEMFSGTLVAGRMPVEADEIILDKLYCDKLIEPVFGIFNNLSLYGYDTYMDFLNEKLSVTDTAWSESRTALKVVGISSADQMCYWGDEGVFYSMYRLGEDVTDLTEKRIKMIALSPSVYAFSFDKATTIAALNDESTPAVDLREANYKARQERNLYNALGRITFTFAIVAVALVSMYFIIRSSMFARIKEIGIYRCLGAKKRELKRMFMWEAIIISLFTSLVGFVVGSWIVAQLLKSTLTMTLFFYPAWLGALVLGATLGLNLLFGMIPVNKLLRLTPSQILSKYDI